MIFYKTAVEELEPLKQEAFENGLSENEWIKKMASTIASILQDNPKQYRGLGPYWWVVKKILLDLDYAFGDFIDAEWYAHVDYVSDVLNLLASYVYKRYSANMGLFESNEHTLYMIDDRGNVEPFVYTLIDDDMEGRII